MANKGLLSALNEHKDKVSGPHFLMSAQNPKYPDKNQLGLSHQQVLGHLKGAGFDAHEVNGHYGSPEQSIAIYGVSPQHAEELHGLASKLGQDSSIYSTGQKHEMRFHHGEDAGKKIHGIGTVWHDKKPQDFYTSLPGGLHHFTHNFNFDKSESNSAINLVHYSNKPDLKEINPKFKGTGVDAGVKGRDTEHPHSFFYIEGTQPENLVANNASHKYRAAIDPKSQPIYDIGTDEHKLGTQVREENQGAFNMDMLHDKIKAKGYHGFKNSTHPQLNNVIAMYTPIKVGQHEKLR